MPKNINQSFTITIGNISHTFTYFSKRNMFRVSSHNNLLNENKYKDFYEPSSQELIEGKSSAYLQARLFFMDVMFDQYRLLWKPITKEYYSIPF